MAGGSKKGVFCFLLIFLLGSSFLPVLVAQNTRPNQRVGFISPKEGALLPKEA